MVLERLIFWPNDLSSSESGSKFYLNRNIIQKKAKFVTPMETTLENYALNWANFKKITDNKGFPCIRGIKPNKPCWKYSIHFLLILNVTLNLFGFKAQAWKLLFVFIFSYFYQICSDFPTQSLMKLQSEEMTKISLIGSWPNYTSPIDKPLFFASYKEDYNLS